MRNISIFAFITALTVAFFAGCQIPPTPTQDSNVDTQVSAEEEAAKQKDVGVAVEVVDENGSMEDVVEDSEAAEDTEVVMMDKPDSGAFASAQYIDYSSSKYAELKWSEPFVLFFHADWCPTCRRMEKDILADLANYPDGTTFLKTDYDTETELKKEYGIRVQSTVVVIDVKGEVVYQATDPALDDLKAAIIRSTEL